MRRIARELGENLSEDELRAMIEEFDNDKDDAINLSEFQVNNICSFFERRSYARQMFI